MRFFESAELLKCSRYAAVIVLFSLSCSSAKKVHAQANQSPGAHLEQSAPLDTVGKLAKIVFDSSAYHFGELKEGQILKREIYFTNGGPGDLVIDLISACECTTLDWSRLPIKPGAKSVIKISYNSKDKDGPQIVDIDITANTQPISTFTKFYLTVHK